MCTSNLCFEQIGKKLEFHLTVSYTIYCIDVSSSRGNDRKIFFFSFFFFGVGVSCRILYSIVSYLYVYTC